MPTRPTAITVLGILNIAFGILGIFMGLIGIIFFYMSHVHPQSNPVVVLGTHSRIYALWYQWGMVLRGIAACVLIASGIGLLRLKPWARIIAIVYAIYAILAGITASFMAALIVVPAIAEQAKQMPGPAGNITTAISYASVGGGCISMIYPIVLLVFMMRRNVAAALRTPSQPPEIPGL